MGESAEREKLFQVRLADLVLGCFRTEKNKRMFEHILLLRATADVFPHF